MLVIRSNAEYQSALRAYHHLHDEFHTHRNEPKGQDILYLLSMTGKLLGTYREQWWQDIPD